MEGNKSESSAEELLNKIELNKYVDIFKEKNIETAEQVFLLNEDEISDLIPNPDDRFKFVLRRESEYKQKCAVIVDVEQLEHFSADGFQCNAASNARNVAGVELGILLNRSFIGKALLRRILLTESDRKKLCQLIIYHLMKDSLSIKRHVFEFWTKEIVAIFKKESEADYYNPCRKSKKNPNGKLYDYYTNLKKWLGKNDVPKTVTPETDANECNVDELKNLLRTNEEIKTSWMNTAKIRDRNLSIADYYEEYPVLNLQIGIELLMIDFGLEQKIDSNIFFTEWPKVVPLILTEGATQKACEDLLSLQGVSQEILSLFILPYLFKPTCPRSKSKRFPEGWKAGKPEISEGFIYRIPTLADLEPNWEKRLDKLRKYGLTQQPIVIAIGTITNITEVYVSINDTKYKCSGLLQGVDYCFKSFFALNAEYSSDSRPVWEFLQRLYGIPFSAEKKLSTNASIVWKNIHK